MGLLRAARWGWALGLVGATAHAGPPSDADGWTLARDAAGLREEVAATDGARWWRVDAAAEDALEVRCDGAARRAVAVGVAGGLALVEADEVEERRGGRWVFAPPAVRGAWQAVRCEHGLPRVSRLREEVSAAWIDAVERRADDWVGLAQALARAPGLEVPPDGPTWAALRPGGGALVAEGALRWAGGAAVPAGRGVVPGSGPMAAGASAPPGAEVPGSGPMDGRPAGARGVVVEVGAVVTAPVQGPARVWVDTRVAGASVCLTVAGRGVCRRPVARGDGAAREVFEAWVPPGRHEVSVSGAGWVAGRVWDGRWLRYPGAARDVASLAEPVAEAPTGGWWADGPRRGVLAPSPGGGWAPADGRAAAWVDGVAELWLAGGRCALDVDGALWVGEVPTGVQRVVGRAGAEVRASGCAAWLRGDGAWAAWSVRAAIAGESVQLAAAPGEPAALRVVVSAERSTVVQVGDARWTVHPVRAAALVGGAGVVARLPAAGPVVTAWADGEVGWIVAPAAEGAGASGVGVAGAAASSADAAGSSTEAAAVDDAWRQLPALSWSAWPEELAWVPEAWGSEGVVAAAAAGDAVTVARAMGASPEALRWWREAAAAQVLTGRDALAAWGAGAEAGVDADSGAAAIAAWSREAPAEGWVGGAPVRAPWPHPPARLPWAPDEPAALRVGAGWVVRVAGPVRARCLSPDGRPCVVRATDAASRELARWSVPSGAAPVGIDAGGGVFLAGPEDDDVVVEVTGAAPDTRRVLEVRGSASLAVRGPTTLRVALDRPAGVRSACPVRWVSEVEAVVIAHDEVACEVVVTGPARLRATVRAPRAGGGTPAELLAVAPPFGWVDAPTVTPVQDQVGWVDPRVVVRAGASVTTRVAGPDEQPGAAQWIARPTVRLDAHRGGWFGSVGAGAWVGPDGVAAGGVAVGGEWRSPVAARWRGWVSADLDLRSQAALGALRGAVEVGASWRGRGVELRAGVGLDAAAGWGAAADALPAVWSAWRADHPALGTLSARARAQPTRWLRAGVVGEVRSNAPGDPMPVDAASAGLELWAAAPRLVAELRVGVQHRTADAHRAEAWTSPELVGEVEGVLWASGRARLMVAGGARWLPGVQLVGMDAGLSVWWAGRPGLVDARPSRVDGRAALGW